MRVTYASQGTGTATVLVASPASDNLPAAPGGVAVSPQGIVLATLPYLPAGDTAAIHVPVGFNLFYGQGNSPQPFIPTLPGHTHTLKPPHPRSYGLLDRVETVNDFHP